MASHSSDPVVPDVTGSGSTAGLLRALDELQQALLEVPLTDVTPSVRRAARVRDEVVRLIGEAMPAAAAGTAPLRVAVVGATGVGKSTLLNTLSKAEVAPVSAVRPTTTAPIWVGSGGDAVHAPGLPAGLVLVEVPDPGPGLTALVPTTQAGDPVLPLEAWDVHLVVTSSTRYGDETLWDRLVELRDVEADVVIVMNKVATDRPGTIHQDLRRKAQAVGLGDVEILSGSDPSGVMAALERRIERAGTASRPRPSGPVGEASAGTPLLSLPERLEPVFEALRQTTDSALTAQAVAHFLGQLARASRSSAVFGDLDVASPTSAEEGRAVRRAADRALEELRRLLRTAARELPSWYRAQLTRRSPELEVASSLAADVAFERDVMAWLARFDPPRPSPLTPADVGADPPVPTVLVAVQTLRGSPRDLARLADDAPPGRSTQQESPGLAMCRELARIVGVALDAHLVSAGDDPGETSGRSPTELDRLLRRRLDVVMSMLDQP